MVEAVFFDVGNTLMYDDPSVPYVFTSAAKRLGYSVEVEDVLPCMDDVNRFYEERYATDGDFWCSHDQAVQLWLDMYSLMARYCGIEDGVPELAQAVYDDYLSPENWSFFPDAAICVKELKAMGLRLGIISNWDASLEGLIRRMGMLPYFDEVVASAAVGCRKPSPAIFEIALERMGVDAAHAVHVGDLPEADGEGASSVGIRPVIIDRKGRFPECAFERIDSLEKIPGILRID